MAIASVGTMGAVGDATSGTSIALTTATTSAAAGSLVVVIVAKDNASAAADSVTNEITSVTDSIGGNTWTKAHEWCNSNAAANAGATCAMYFSVLTNAIPTGSTITANFSDARTSSAISAWNYSLAAGSTIIVHQTANLSNDAADPGSLGFSFTQSDLLFVRAIASETDSVTALTGSGSWTVMTQAVADAGAAGVGMGIRGEFRIAFNDGNDSPTINSNPTFTAVDHSSIAVAFIEVYADQFTNHEGGVATGGNNSSGTSFTMTSITGHGPDSVKTGFKSLLVCTIAFDNTSTGSDGDNGEVSSVADNDGNSWTKAGEWINTQGAAGAGAGCAIYWLSPSVALTSAVITVTFGVARTAKAAAVQSILYPSNYTLSMESFSGLSNDAADAGNIDPTVSNKVHAWCRVICNEEGSFQGFTPTTNFWASNGLVQGSGATGIEHINEYCMGAAATNKASNPTFGATHDKASGYAVFTLDPPAGGDVQDPFGQFGIFGI